jgi:hypothetical protein
MSGICTRFGACVWGADKLVNVSVLIVNSNLMCTTPGQAAVPVRHDTNDRDESQGQCVKDEPGRVSACCEAQLNAAARPHCPPHLELLPTPTRQ